MPYLTSSEDSYQSAIYSSGYIYTDTAQDGYTVSDIYDFGERYKYYNHGTEIEYKIEEYWLSNEYTQTYSGDAENGFTITSTHEPEEYVFGIRIILLYAYNWIEYETGYSAWGTSWSDVPTTCIYRN